MSKRVDLGTRREPPSQTRKRMSPENRKALIVDEAISFFAEHGFEGRTRDLAERVGITQPLLYRYFPNKESLIEQVYQEVYIQRWNPQWEGLISDGARPLKDRLTEFYKAYSRAVYDYVWVRIFLYSGLKAMDINDRYLAIIRDKVLAPVCAELRRDAGLPTAEAVPIGPRELEIAWGLHGMFFYRAVRHFAYGLPMVEDVDDAIERDVAIFLAGVHTVHKTVVEQAAVGLDLRTKKE